MASQDSVSTRPIYSPYRVAHLTSRRIDHATIHRYISPRHDDLVHAARSAALQIAGVSPVPLALADVYTGLQTGLIDTVAASPIACIAFQWHTKVRYLTDIPLMYLAGVLGIDARAFARIGAADQEILRDVIGTTAVRMDKLNRESDASAKLALRKHGIEFVTGTPQELERWRGIADAALSKMRERGLYSEEMIEALLGHLDAYRERSATASE